MWISRHLAVGRLGRAALAFAALAVLAAAPAVSAAEQRKAGEVVSETKVLTAADGRQVRYEIGAVFVPENRDAKTSRIIAVGFARLRPAEPTGAPPMFVLPGGPGDSYLGAFSETTDRARRQQAQLLQLSRAGDVVVIDQRGYSRRGEVLGFVGRPRDLPLDRPASLAADTAENLKIFKAAVAANADKDLSGYTVLQCVEDVNDLRQALGYGQITLVGQSFGSQWSFAVMRRRPEIVARALLSGVEPLDYAYDMPSHIYAALQRIAWDADHDPGLRPYLPNGGVMAAVGAVQRRLAKAPVRVRIKDDKTGRMSTVALGREDFQRAMLTPAADWPALVLSAYHGRYDDWARAVAAQRRASDERDALIGPLIDTSLGVTPAREHLLRTDAGVAAMGWWDFDAYIATLESMQIGEMLKVRQAQYDRFASATK